MYFTDHIPPDRAWFAVSADLGVVRELSFDDVQALESPCGRKIRHAVIRSGFSAKNLVGVPRKV